MGGTRIVITDKELDLYARGLIPILDRVSMPEPIHGDDPPMPDLNDTPERYVVAEDQEKTSLPEADNLQLAIQGRALMAISTPAPLRDGSYRIVLSPNENWVVKSMMASGLDSSTEIVLILAPRI